MKSYFLKKFNSNIDFFVSSVLNKDKDEEYISKKISFNSVLFKLFTIISI